MQKKWQFDGWERWLGERRVVLNSNPPFLPSANPDQIPVEYLGLDESLVLQNDIIVDYRKSLLREIIDSNKNLNEFVEKRHEVAVSNGHSSEKKTVLEIIKGNQDSLFNSDDFNLGLFQFDQEELFTEAEYQKMINNLAFVQSKIAFYSQPTIASQVLDAQDQGKINKLEIVEEFLLKIINLIQAQQDSLMFNEFYNQEIVNEDDNIFTQKALEITQRVKQIDDQLVLSSGQQLFRLTAEKEALLRQFNNLNQIYIRKTGGPLTNLVVATYGVGVRTIDAFTRQRSEEEMREMHEKRARLENQYGIDFAKTVFTYFAKGLDNNLEMQIEAIGTGGSIDYSKAHNILKDCWRGSGDVPRSLNSNNQELVKFFIELVQIKRNQSQAEVDDRQTVENYSEHQGTIEGLVTRYADRVMDGDVSAIGLMVCTYLLLPKKNRSKYFAGILGAYFLNEQAKEEGFDLLNMLNLDGGFDSLLQDTVEKAQLDDIEQNLDQLNPETWEREAMEAPYRTLLFASMGNAPISELNTWNENVMSNIDKQKPLEDQEGALWKDIPSSLKKTYEDMQNYQRLDKWEFAAMATGTLSLFYKKIAHDEGESASPENGRNLLKQNSKQIKDIAASLNKIAKDVTLHDVVNYNTDPVRLLESSTDPQSLIEKARMGLANIWQSKDVILPSVFGQDGWDITQWPEAVLEKVVQFTKFIEGVWGEYAPVVFANLKKAGIKIYEFTGDRIMLAYEAARDSEVARIIVEHTGDIIGFLPSLGWKLVNSAALFAEKGIEFTAEMIPQALEAMQQIGEQYLEAWTVQLSNPDQRVEMNDCDSLVNAIKNEPDLRKAIKNNYGLIRDQDIDIFLERIWGDDGAYFAELVSLSGASPDFVTSKQLTHQQLKLVFQDSWRYLDGALENLTKAVVYGENAAVGLADAGQQMFFWGTGLAESIVLSSDLSRQASEKVSEFLEMAKIDPNLAEIPQPNNIDFLNQLVAEKSNNTANQSEVWTYEKLVLIARDSFKTAMSEKYNMDYPPLPPLTENEIFVGIKEAKEQFSGLFIDNQGNDQVDFINQLLNAGPGDNIDCYGEDIEMPEYTGENDSYEYVGIKIEALAKSIIERKVSKIQI